MTIHAETLTITLTNCVFSYLPHTALFIDNKCRGKNTIHIENCTVESNTHKYNAKQKHLGCKKIARPRRSSIVNKSVTKRSDIR